MVATAAASSPRIVCRFINRSISWASTSPSRFRSHSAKWARTTSANFWRGSVSRPRAWESGSSKASRLTVEILAIIGSSFVVRRTLSGSSRSG